MLFRSKYTQFPHRYMTPPPIPFLFRDRGEGGIGARHCKGFQAITQRWHVKGGGFGPYLKCVCEGGSHHFLSWSGWTLLRVDGFPAIDKLNQMVYNSYMLNHFMSSFMDLLGNVITQLRFVNVSLEM